MKEVNLEQILADTYGCKDVDELKKDFNMDTKSVAMFVEATKEACRQVLELAYNNYDCYEDKQSILRTIKQVK